MAKTQKLTVELPDYQVTQIKYWAAKFGLTGSQMIMYFTRLGLSHYTMSDTVDYLQYLSRQVANKKKGQKNGK